MIRILLALAVCSLLPSFASADISTPVLWYAANVGLEGFACGECDGQSFEGCGCQGWLSCQQGICGPAGGYGEACKIDDDRAIKTGCLDALGCVDGVCIPIGSEGEVCRREAYYYNPFLKLTGQDPNQWPSNCDTSLACTNGYCQTPLPVFAPPPPPCFGKEECECRPAERRIEGCDPDLLCDQDRDCRHIWDMTLRAAYASEAVYAAEDANPAELLVALDKADLTAVEYSGELGWFTDVEALIAANDDVIVVSIAGSESLQDWLANMDMANASWLARLVGGPLPLLDPATLVDPFDLYKGGWLPCGSANKAGCDTKHKVHPGFLDYAHELYRGFLKKELRTEYNKKHRPIQVVGHSLGGAVAQLIAAQIVTDMALPVDAVVTFGSPKVGDANWEKVYEKLLHRATHRWVFFNDPVPNLPALASWKRAGQQHYLHRDTYELDSPDHAKTVQQVQPLHHPLSGSYIPALEALAR